MTAFPSFIGGSSRSQSQVTDNQRTMNWFREASDGPGAVSEASLYPTPGVEPFSAVASVGGRAILSVTIGGLERCFAVIGPTLYELFAGGTSSVRGTVVVDANPATICTNGDGGGQLFITSGDHGYCYDLASDVLTEELTSGATMGGMLYGYFVVFNRANSQCRISDLFDGTVWDPLQFFGRTIGSDPWRAMWITPYGQIFLPGLGTGEVWYNAGSFPVPFAPDPSGLFERGAAASFSIQQAGNSVVWLASAGEGGYQVVRATGFTPEPISTHAVENAIKGYSRIDDAIGQTYSEAGHTFYLLTFPTANATWAYDFTTKQWHERGTWIAEDAAYQYWRPMFHAFAFGHHLMADRQSNIVYRMADDLPLDIEGRVIRRLRRGPTLRDGHRRVFVPRLGVILETGLGLAHGQGEDPQVMLRTSMDSGKTWGNELSRSAGRIGNYQAVTEFNRLGSTAAGWQAELVVTDPIVNWRITSVDLDAHTGKGRKAA